MISGFKKEKMLSKGGLSLTPKHLRNVAKLITVGSRCHGDENLTRTKLNFNSEDKENLN